MGNFIQFGIFDGICNITWRHHNSRRRFWIIHNRALDPVLFTDLLQNCAVIYCCQKSPHIHIKTHSGNYSLVKGFGCLKCSLCSPKTWHTVLEGRQNVLQAAIKYAQHTNRVQILKGGMGWYSCPETEACTWHALCKQMPSGLTATQTLGPPFPPILQNFSFCKGSMEERDSANKCISTAHQGTQQPTQWTGRWNCLMT